MSKFLRKPQPLPAGCVFVVGPTYEVAAPVLKALPLPVPVAPKFFGPVRSLKEIAWEAECVKHNEVRRLKKEKEAAKAAAKAAKEAAAAAAKAAKPVRLRKDGKPWGSPKD